MLSSTSDLQISKVAVKIWLDIINLRHISYLPIPSAIYEPRANLFYCNDRRAVSYFANTLLRDPHSSLTSSARCNISREASCIPEIFSFLSEALPYYLRIFCKDFRIFVQHRRISLISALYLPLLDQLCVVYEGLEGNHLLMMIYR